MSRLKLSKKLQLNDTRPAGVLQLMKDNLQLMAPCDAAIAEAAATPAEAARLFKQSNRNIMGTSTKVELGEGFGYYTSVLYLAPAKLSGYEGAAVDLSNAQRGASPIRAVTSHFTKPHPYSRLGGSSPTKKNFKLQRLRSYTPQ